MESVLAAEHLPIFPGTEGGIGLGVLGADDIAVVRGELRMENGEWRLQRYTLKERIVFGGVFHMGMDVDETADGLAAFC